MTTPFKALRMPVDIKDYAQVLSHYSNDKCAEVAIKLTEVLIEKRWA